MRNALEDVQVRWRRSVATASAVPARLNHSIVRVPPFPLSAQKRAHDSALLGASSTQELTKEIEALQNEVSRLSPCLLAATPSDLSTRHVPRPPPTTAHAHS